MASRPTFFLSSTIYDFRDLRGAIKFSLEARGCRVLASEFNDFGENLAQHSYEACLSNIAQADYFVLLIGSRVGGWYDAPARVSITQQEYRAAYELHLQGKLRLVSFVRQEVWQLKEDRKELTRYLSNLSLTDSEKTAVATAPSKFANDADFVAAFITEVGRNVETGQAVKTGSAKPTGNWIHQFRDFRDIHDVLGPLAFSGLTSEDAAYRQALQGELLKVMSALTAKADGQVLDFRPRLKRGLTAQPITVETRHLSHQTVELQAWNDFTTAFFQVMGLRFETVVIDDALTSTIFLDFDPDRGGYVQSAAYDALSKLWDEIRQFNGLSTMDNVAIIFATTPKALGRKTGPYELSTDKVALLYGLAHRWINIVSLCQALIAHLAGQAYQAPELLPFSPIQGLEEHIMSERVTPADLRVALGLEPPT
jgi:hypothetical protein